MSLNTLPSFSRKKEDQVFFKLLNSRVLEYFQTNKIKKTGNARLFLKSLVMLTLYFGSFACLLIFNMSIGLQILLCIIAGVGMAGVGMNVMHDACHGAYSDKKWVNKLIAGTMYLLSGNVFNWKVQHNMLHHTYTNVHGHDEDLEAGRIVRFSKFAKWIPMHKFQHYYTFLLYGFLTLNWFFTTDFKQSIQYLKRRLSEGDRPDPVKHWITLIFFKIAYIFIWLVLPIYLMPNPWWHIIIGFLLMHYVSGFILSLIFQLAHVVEDTVIIDGTSNNQIDNSWAAHQLYTTTNFSVKSRFLNWFTGGLNHQVEHHLFPSISHIHYQKISGIVKQTVKECKLPYHEYPTILEAIKSHYRHIKSLSTPNATAS